VRSDHAALTCLHKFSGKNARLLLWRLRLAECDFILQHRPGAKIQHVDALSRHVLAVTTEPTILKDTVRKEQATDAVLYHIVRKAVSLTLADAIPVVVWTVPL
jgi:hypothetical protein